MRKVFEQYLLALRNTLRAEKTEHTDRSALEVLLNAFAAHASRSVRVQHEPKKVASKGAPDFKIMHVGSILGYVENKKIGEQLDVVLKSDQIKKYRSLSSNIVLTDYLQFIWIDGDGIRARETLCFESDLDNPRFRLRDDKIAAVSGILSGFFSVPPQGIGRAHDLALALATRSQLLRDFLASELVRQGRERREGRLYGLFNVFKDQVFHELSSALQLARLFVVFVLRNTSAATGNGAARLHSATGTSGMRTTRARSYAHVVEIVDYH